MIVSPGGLLPAGVAIALRLALPLVLASACGSSSPPSTTSGPSHSTTTEPSHGSGDGLSNTAKPGVAKADGSDDTKTDDVKTDGTTPADVLAITTLEPPKGDSSGGTYVLIKGRGFIKDGPRKVKVYFGSRRATIVRFASDGELIVEAPGGTSGEVVDVLVVFDPGGEMKLPSAFTFVDQGP